MQSVVFAYRCHAKCFGARIFQQQLVLGKGKSLLWHLKDGLTTKFEKKIAQKFENEKICCLVFFKWKTNFAEIWNFKWLTFLTKPRRKQRTRQFNRIETWNSLLMFFNYDFVKTKFCLQIMWICAITLSKKSKF